MGGDRFEYDLDELTPYLEQIERQEKCLTMLRAEITALKKEVKYLQDELMVARGDANYYRTTPESER